jgi:hypothetical protein
VLSLRDKMHSSAETVLKLAFMGRNPGLNLQHLSLSGAKKSHAFLIFAPFNPGAEAILPFGFGAEGEGSIYFAVVVGWV